MSQTTNTNTHIPLSYLALGDSYTIGESVKEAERYPVLLTEKLKHIQIKIDTPHIIARTGWTTDELMAAILAKNTPNNYDLVSLLIGVNNQYRGYPINTYQTEFEELLKIAIQKAKGNTKRVFLVSIPDYGVTPFASNSNTAKIAQEIDDYNKIAQEIAKKYQVKYFDITSISRRAKNDLSLIADDDLHPSGKMYAEWVALIFDEVAMMIK
ncbi:MAG: SGNH/GDSL hydrolase family protein [Cytophagales bacterium]|nr:MAG: SGNH/GDSL hydrolase family protein [Cytophagales bacterium]